MTGDSTLDWAIQAVSLFNVILLAWLGLAVLLNAERRSGGILLASGGLLSGAAFFISHSAILGHDPDMLTSGQDFWWYLGWIPVVFLPLAWYMVMLWYTGFWEAHRASEDPARRLYRRHGGWLVLTWLTAAVLLVLLFFAHLLPSFTQIAHQGVPNNLSVQGLPLLAMVYPVYAALCMGLSLDALRHPGPSRRWLGEQARRRAQPWLAAAGLLLLAVSLLVGAAMAWVLFILGRSAFTQGIDQPIRLLDLLISGLIALSVLSIGQAVVYYEIFTARTLPRNGLLQHWRRAVILAGGYSLVGSWSLTISLRPVYSLLMTTLVMTVFFALLAWRSFGERERFIQSLRPFISGNGVYPRILEPSAQESSVDTDGLFQALCSQVLEAGRACLAPLGELAAMAGLPVTYPPGEPVPALPFGALAGQFHSPDESGLPLDPQQYAGFIWSVPLWSERGLAGVLLLGEKRTGSLYTLEEIEIARAAGERLIDLKASAELARRLAMLQRHQLAHSQIMDQQTRRMLHDEVLPQIHTALLTLSSLQGDADESVEILTHLHHQLSDLLHSTAKTTTPDVSRLGLTGALRQVVERDLQGSFGSLDWRLQDGVEEELKRLPLLQAEVLFFAAREALRNAARYGRPAGETPLAVTIRLECQEGLELCIEDNGAGIEPGLNFSPSAAGSGIGLDLHSTLMAVIGGSLALESEPGKYTRVKLRLPWQA